MMTWHIYMSMRICTVVMFICFLKQVKILLRLFWDNFEFFYPKYVVESNVDLISIEKWLETYIYVQQENMYCLYPPEVCLSGEFETHLDGTKELGAHFIAMLQACHWNQHSKLFPHLLLTKNNQKRPKRSKSQNMLLRERCKKKKLKKKY